MRSYHASVLIVLPAALLACTRVRLSTHALEQGAFRSFAALASSKSNNPVNHARNLKP